MFQVPNIRKNFIPVAICVGILHLILAGVEFEVCCWRRALAGLEWVWQATAWEPDWQMGLSLYTLAAVYLLLVGWFALPFVHHFKRAPRGDHALRLMGLAHALLMLATGLEIIRITERPFMTWSFGPYTLSQGLALNWFELSTYLWLPIAGWLLTLLALGTHARRYFTVNRELAGIVASATLSIVGLVIGLGLMVSVP
ncbi:MAG: hypothetical protein AMXMBFR7_10500 [Planctomycetota bacterium]